MSWQGCAVAFIINAWVLHCYAALCAVIFQAFERNADQELATNHINNIYDQVYPLLKENVLPIDELNRKLILSVDDFYKKENLQDFQTFRLAFLYSVSSMATLGNSGYHLRSSLSKVFYVVAISLGILVYAFAIYFGSRLLRYAFSGLISAIEGKSINDVAYPYMKMMVAIDIIFISLIQVGGVYAICIGGSYFNGIYTALDIMGSIGTITIRKDISVVGISAFMLFGLSSLCALIVISIKSSAELEMILSSACCPWWFGRGRKRRASREALLAKN